MTRTLDEKLIQICHPVVGGSDHPTCELFCSPDDSCYTLTMPSQHYTFYDFIVNKARGKSGPLFSFDVHDDVRLLHDATKERDEVCNKVPPKKSHDLTALVQSHAGKVVERSWYQRSKHIFPASRWEVYPAVSASRSIDTEPSTFYRSTTQTRIMEHTYAALAVPGMGSH